MDPFEISLNASQDQITTKGKDRKAEAVIDSSDRSLSDIIKEEKYGVDRKSSFSKFSWVIKLLAK